MLDIQVNEVKGAKDFNVNIKVQGSALKIAQELHLVNRAIIERIPEVGEKLCELIKED